MYKKILVALDGSQYSDHALNASLEISGKHPHGEVIGCHVYASKLHRVRFMEMEDGLPERYQAEEKLNHLRNTHEDLIGDGMQLISDAYLAPLVKRAQNTNVKITGLTPEGKHYVKFIEAANEHHPDLILTGAWGHGKDDELTLGSFTQRTLTHIDTSDILILKKPLNFKNKPIVVGIDGSINSYNALNKALRIAEKFGVKVHLVAVFDPFFHLTVFKKIAEVLPKKDQERFNFPAQEKLHDEIIDKGLEKIYEDYLEKGRLFALSKKIKVKTKLLIGKIVPKIHQYSSLHNASLIVLGRWGSHKESISHIGSNALNLVHKCFTNILIVSSEDKELKIPELEKKELKELEWTENAKIKLQRVPGFVRKMVKKTVENKAREKGLKVVTVDLINEVSPKKM
jgi:nucleotide-binding universal stress UspA family protein